MTVSCLTTAMDTPSCSQKVKGRKPKFTDYELRVLLTVQFLKSQTEVNNLKKIKLELQIALLREKEQTTAAALR